MKCRFLAALALPFGLGYSSFAQTANVTTNLDIKKTSQTQEVNDTNFIHTDASFVLQILDIPGLISNIKQTSFGSYLLNDESDMDIALKSLTISSGSISSEFVKAIKESPLNDHYSFALGYAMIQYFSNKEYTFENFRENYTLGLQESLKTTRGEQESDQDQLVSILNAYTNTFLNILTQSKQHKDPILTVIPQYTENYENTPTTLVNIFKTIGGSGSQGLSYEENSYHGIETQGLRISLSEIIPMLLANPIGFADLNEEQIKHLQETTIYVLLTQQQDRNVYYVCTNPETQIKPLNTDTFPKIEAPLKTNLAKKDYVHLYASKSLVSSFNIVNPNYYTKCQNGIKNGILKSLLHLADQINQAQNCMVIPLKKLPGYVEEMINTLTLSAEKLNQACAKSSDSMNLTIYFAQNGAGMQFTSPYQLLLGEEAPMFSGIETVKDPLLFTYGSYNGEMINNGANLVTSAIGITAFGAWQALQLQMVAAHEDSQKAVDVVRNIANTFIGQLASVVLPKWSKSITDFRQGYGAQNGMVVTSASSEEAAKLPKNFPPINFAYMNQMTNHADVTSTWKDITTILASQIVGSVKQLGNHLGTWSTNGKTNIFTFTGLNPEHPEQAPMMRLSENDWTICFPGNFYQQVSASLEKPTQDNQDKIKAYLNIKKLDQTVITPYQLGSKIDNISPELSKCLELFTKDIKCIQINGRQTSEKREIYMIEVLYN